MKTLIIESTSKTKPLLNDFSDTSIVHCRNSLILRDHLKADLLDGEYVLEDVLKNRYDVIVCCYASPYMPHIPYRQVIDANPDARLVWLVNDHDLEDNQLLRYAIEKGRSYDMICNNPRSGYRHWILGKNIGGKKLNDWIDRWHTCNLNSLIFTPPTASGVPFQSGLIYYGTYRKHRAEDFARYLKAGVTVSSSIKHWKKYVSLGCDASFIRPLKWTKGAEDLRAYAFSLYLEDKHTHTNYAFMANRFYEALQCGVVPLFAANCADNVARSGYVVSTNQILPSDLKGAELMEYCASLDFEALRHSQRNLTSVIEAERLEVLSGISAFLGV